MSLSTQKHGALYRSEEILYTYQEVHRGMETRSIDRGSTWPSISLQYQHNHEEWDEDLDNDEIEHVLP
jgi:hypothetical protein